MLLSGLPLNMIIVWDTQRRCTATVICKVTVLPPPPPLPPKQRGIQLLSRAHIVREVPAKCDDILISSRPPSAHPSNLPLVTSTLDVPPTLSPTSSDVSTSHATSSSPSPGILFRLAATLSSTSSNDHPLSTSVHFPFFAEFMIHLPPPSSLSSSQ